MSEGRDTHTDETQGDEADADVLGERISLV